MKKWTFVLLCLFMSIGFASAQTKVTGVVLSAEDGQPVIGASVKVKGATAGTITDVDGKFSITAPAGAKTLVVSFVGTETQEIAAASTVRVVLKASSKALNEVVVTAMGVKRSQKAIGYSATSINGDDISKNRTADVMSSLAGKVAGVQISSTSSDPGTSNSVVIRGISSLSGNNQPLYIIDGVPLNNSSVYSSDGLNNAYDFGSGANAVNPDDVENMTILKGAAATALYGNRAASGVILITTKSGTEHQKGIGVEYNGGLQFSSVLRLPQMQNEFGMGWSGDKTQIENGSWGPKFDGTKELYGQIYNNSQQLKSYSVLKNNVKDFFDTGVRYSNSLSFNGANKSSSYFVSFSQLSDDGILPTNSDSYDKYTYSLRGSHKIKAVTLSTSLNYENQLNRFASTGQGFSMVNSIYQTPRDISIIGLKDLNNPFNTPGYYYTPYGITNPYYILENNLNEYTAEKVYGKFQLDYDFWNNFKFTYRIGLDATSSEQNQGTPNLKALFAGTPNASGNLEKEEGSVTVSTTHRREINQDFLLNYNKNVNNFSIGVLAGANLNERKYSSLSSGITGLDIPTWYNLSNSATTPVVSTYNSLRRLYGVFGQVDLAWKSLIFLTATARNDWSSTLPKDNNSFFYPGITGSFAFTELLPKNNILTFGKVRAAYGQTGNDASVYMIDPVFAQATANASGWGGVSFPLKGINAFSQGNVLGNKNLSPEITTEYELGTYLAFFNGRLTFDGAVYNRQSDKQIFSLNMDPASGYTAQNMNLGKVENKGVELLLTGRPIQTKDFSWEVSVNYTKNNSKVISLPEELGGIANIYGLTGGTTMYAIVGQPVGTYKAEVAERDPNGNIVVNPTNGLPVAAANFAIVGNMNYDYEMGISNTFKYKGFSVGFDIDIRQGGLMFSRTKNLNYFVGNAIQTAYNDRNPFIVPNSVNKITASNGTISYVENTTPVAVNQLGTYWDNGGVDMGSSDLIDKSYVKLRSVVVSWELPHSWLKNSPLSAVRLSAYGNNLLLWTPDTNTFIDPETSSFGNDLSGKYGEYTANPSTRRIGFNLMAKF